MFRVGQKVVFIGCPDGKQDGCIEPPKDSIVLLKHKKDFWFATCWAVDGYELSSDGNPQYFKSNAFRPLDYEFVEEVIKQVKPMEKIDFSQVTDEKVYVPDPNDGPKYTGSRITQCKINGRWATKKQLKAVNKQHPCLPQRAFESLI